MNFTPKAVLINCIAVSPLKKTESITFHFQSCDETPLAINTEEVVVCNTTEVNTQIRSNHSSTNGSIITMTLKNNHLIVETEERNVSNNRMEGKL